MAHAAGADGKLGWTMACIRAAESINLFRMDQCAAAYPFLASLVDTSDPNTRTTENMPRLREHALELAKESISEEVEQLRTVHPEAPNASGRRQLKENILKQLKCLLAAG